MSFVPLQTTKGFFWWPGSDGFSSRRVYPWVQAGVRISLPLCSLLSSQQVIIATRRAGKNHPAAQAHLLTGEQGCAMPTWHRDTNGTSWHDTAHLVTTGFRLGLVMTA